MSEVCEAPVSGMPTKNDASVVVISGILHKEQVWNGRLFSDQ